MNISPVNLTFDTAIRVRERPLEWYNYSNPPKLMKLTNTGKTVMLSGKWYQERPYIKEGPLTNAYIFSQIHFHWGSTEFEGSEHGIEGKKMAMEMHIVHFNAKYKNLQEAKNKVDGIAVVAFLFRIDDKQNESLNQLINQLSLVHTAFASVNIDPFPLKALNFEFFETNYFIYCGAVGRESKPHLILWLIYPIPFAITHAQVAKFRDLKTPNGDLMKSNYHEMQNIINPNGVFFLDQIIDKRHRRESSLFCLPSLQHISKISSLVMNEQNLHTLELKTGNHEKDIINNDFSLRVKDSNYINTFLKEIQPSSREEKVAMLGTINNIEVETVLKSQMKWTEDPCKENDSQKVMATYIPSRLETERENGNKLDSSDCNSETYIGEAIGSTTFRLTIKQEYAATSYHTNSIHNAKDSINAEKFQSSDTSLREARGSTIKRIDSSHSSTEI